LDSNHRLFKPTIHLASGYLTSIASVVLLGAVAWKCASKDPWCW